MSQAFCRCGCGFYGNPATDGMCSKCFKDSMKRKQAPPPTSNSTSTNTISNQITNALSNSLNDSNASNMVASIAAALNNMPEKNLEQIEKQNYKEEIEKSKLVKLEADATVAAEKELLDNTPVNDSSASKSETVSSDAPKIQKKKKTRCTKCKVNVGCIGFPCRCGGIFCSTHRYANEHSCTFDYKEHGAEEIRKNNPQIVGEKIQKI